MKYDAFISIISFTLTYYDCKMLNTQRRDFSSCSSLNILVKQHFEDVTLDLKKL